MTRKRRTQRLRRVDETLRQVISDSTVADVYVQVPGNEARRQKSLAALERVRPAIQARINDEMHLRLTPVLRFRVDETLEQGLRIERLLAEHRPVEDGE